MNQCSSYEDGLLSFRFFSCVLWDHEWIFTVWILGDQHFLQFCWINQQNNLATFKITIGIEFQLAFALVPPNLFSFMISVTLLPTRTYIYFWPEQLFHRKNCLMLHPQYWLCLNGGERNTKAMSFIFWVVVHLPTTQLVVIF